MPKGVYKRTPERLAKSRTAHQSEEYRQRQSAKVKAAMRRLKREAQ